MSKSKYTKFGNIWAGKNGSFYIKLEKGLNITINGVPLESEFIQMNKPEENLKRLHSLGFLTEDQLSERAAKLPENLKYELSISPAKK
jgi:hypothetical protein